MFSTVAELCDSVGVTLQAPLDNISNFIQLLLPRLRDLPATHSPISEPTFSNILFARKVSVPNLRCRWTIFLVARTAQAIGDTTDMGILSATAATSAGAVETGLHIYKTTSTCVSTAGINGGQPPGCAQGKFTKFRSAPRCRILFLISVLVSSCSAPAPHG